MADPGRAPILRTKSVTKKQIDTGKPVLETTCIKRPPALRDHCSDTATLLNST